MADTSAQYEEFRFRGIPDGPNRGDDEFGLTVTVSTTASTQSAVDFEDLLLAHGYKAMEEYMVKTGTRFANVKLTRQRFADVEGDGRSVPVGPQVIVDECRAKLGVIWSGRAS